MSIKEIAKSVESVEIAKKTVEKGDASKGQKLYLKKLKKACGMNGAKFAAQHTQDEWEEIRENGQFGQEVQNLCPNVKSFNQRWEKDIYEFCYEYANDSGNVPSC
ncbi:MAG: cytochrome C [Epsilonproteobacteria bacterium]|nr:cytochrome C [Campylobacterota bacterium]